MGLVQLGAWPYLASSSLILASSPAAAASVNSSLSASCGEMITVGVASYWLPVAIPARAKAAFEHVSRVYIYWNHGNTAPRTDQLSS